MTDDDERTFHGPVVGAIRGGGVAVQLGSDPASHTYRLDHDDAAWLRDRLDETIALLDGGEVTTDHESESESGTDRESERGDEPDDESDDAVACPDCGKEFVSERGVAIHQGRSGCGDDEQQGSAGGSDPGDEDDPDSASPTDDTPNGGGDDTGDAEYPCPVCGEEFASTQAMRSHRDDVHDEIEIKRAYREQVPKELPSHVSLVDVEAAAAASRNLHEVAEDLRMSRTPVKRIVNKLGLGDVLDEHSEAQACHLVEDLHDDLGIDEPLPEVPGEGDGGETA